jgi:hypothetical protein
MASRRARRHGACSSAHRISARSIVPSRVRAGLAERVVPQRPREDPLLLDEGRRAIDPALIGQDERGRAERLLLKLAIGAAAERLYLSYPRLDVSETRPGCRRSTRSTWSGRSPAAFPTTVCWRQKRPKRAARASRGRRRRIRTARSTTSNTIWRP